MKELENIDLEAKFFQLNTASTTLSIAVNEAVANANSELTRQISHDDQNMKVSRAKKVLFQKSLYGYENVFSEQRRKKEGNYALYTRTCAKTF